MRLPSGKSEEGADDVELGEVQIRSVTLDLRLETPDRGLAALNLRPGDDELRPNGCRRWSYVEERQQPDRQR